MSGWLIAGALVFYWYVLKQYSTKQLVDVIRNELSGFSAYNQAGLTTGAVTAAGGHDSAPGSCATPLGITSAEPSSMAGDSSTTVAPSPVASVPVGSLAAAPWRRRWGVASRDPLTGVIRL